MSDFSDEKKSDHNTVVATYLEYNISKEKIFLPVCSFLSLFFMYQKINDRIMTKWQGTLYPLHLFFILQFLKCFINIIKPEKEKEEDDESINYKSWKLSLINSGLVIGAIYNFGEYMDLRKDQFLFNSMYLAFVYCFSQILYSLLRKNSMFSIKKNLSHGDSSIEDESTLGFITSLTTPVLTYFSNMMIICNSGVCTQLYMSTIASLLGAFGVSLSNLSQYLFPITVVLLGISLYSLYAKKKDLMHGPFLLGVFSTVLIILSNIWDKTCLYYLMYPGNVLMIGAAIWNAKVNKLYGLPRYMK